LAAILFIHPSQNSEFHCLGCFHCSHKKSRSFYFGVPYPFGRSTAGMMHVLPCGRVGYCWRAYHQVIGVVISYHQPITLWVLACIACKKIMLILFISEYPYPCGGGRSAGTHVPCGRVGYSWAYHQVIGGHIIHRPIDPLPYGCLLALLRTRSHFTFSCLSPGPS
jgi:hypothetical protein